MGEIEEPVSLKKLAAQVPGVLYQFRMRPDGSFCFPYASSGLRDVLAAEPEDVIEDASSVFELLSWEERQRVVDSIQESAMLMIPWRCVFMITHPLKGERWLQGDAKPERMSDGSVLWHGYIADITEREQERRALRESEARYRILAQYAPEAILIFDVEEDRFVDANQQAELLFGFSRAELIGRNVIGVSPVFQSDGTRSDVLLPQVLSRALNGETSVTEWVHLNNDGDEILCEVRIVAIPFGGKQLLRGSITDIRARKFAERRLQQFEAAIESSLSAIVVTDAEGRIAWVNDAFLKVLGYSAESEVIGRPFAHGFTDRAQAADVARAVFRDGAWTGELKGLRSDGSERTFAVQASVYDDPHGAPLGLVASFVDTTEEHRLQAQLLQAQRLESVGRLAGGVAHDFNNLLTVMKGYLELARLDQSEPQMLGHYLNEIHHAIDSASSLTRQLLVFSRRQVISPQALDLNSVVRRTMGMLHRILGEHILVHHLAGEGLGTVRFDPGQMEQVLVNLAVNARDAMPAGGDLTISTSNVQLSKKQAASMRGMKAGRHVLLRVSDTGTGMSESDREHVFEPFFTTKGPGEGTGLGLAMIHGAVTQNGGYIELDSELGVGTCFSIYLPEAAGEVSQADTITTVEDVGGGSERVLLVEDDDRLRSLTERLLIQLGYEVVSFEGGREALEWLESGMSDSGDDGGGTCCKTIDLLLTDVVMPRMDGWALASAVRELCPRMRVMFVSGYVGNVRKQVAAGWGGAPVLAKPFTRQSLARAVRLALDSQI